MNANNVFIGLTLDNEEVLLYKEFNDKFINLKTKECIDSSDVKIDSLIPYTRLKKYKHQLKGTIIRTFEKDRNKKLDVSNIFIGNILQTTNYEFVRGYNYDLPMIYWVSQYRITSQIIKKNALLYRLNKGYICTSLDDKFLYGSDFIDLETEIKYSNKNYSEIGGLFIDTNMTSYLSLVSYDGSLEEKKNVLKKYRERRGK